MVEYIKKRDGRVVAFDRDKIYEAMNKAFTANHNPKSASVLNKLTDQVIAQMEQTFSADSIPSVEEIQDLVERVLMDNGYVQTAKAYILYRAERSRAREMNTRLMQIYEDITFSAARDSDFKRENANIDGDTAMGAMLKYGSEGAKQFYDMFVLNPDHAKAHRDGDIHIHDLDFLTLTTTCCQIDIDQALSRRILHRPRHACGSPTTSPPMPPWPASPSSPTRTTSTAVRASSILTTAWPTACARPLSSGYPAESGQGR